MPEIEELVVAVEGEPQPEATEVAPAAVEAAPEAAPETAEVAPVAEVEAEIEIPNGDEAEGLIMEAVEPTGSVIDVLLIQAGMSKNRRRYSEAVLRESVPLLRALVLLLARALTTIQKSAA